MFRVGGMMFVLLGVCDGARMVMSEKLAEEKRGLKVESAVDSTATEAAATHTDALQKEEESAAADLSDSWIFTGMRALGNEMNKRSGRQYEGQCEDVAQQSVRGLLDISSYNRRDFDKDVRDLARTSQYRTRLGGWHEACPNNGKWQCNEWPAPSATCRCSCPSNSRFGPGCEQEVGYNNIGYQCTGTYKCSGVDGLLWLAKAKSLKCYSELNNLSCKCAHR